jgi:hypothetical protein
MENEKVEHRGPNPAFCFTLPYFNPETTFHFQRGGGGGEVGGGY